MKFDMGDDYYNERETEYYWADEVGWIHIATKTVVQAHGGFETRRQREDREDDIRLFQEDRWNDGRNHRER